MMQEARSVFAVAALATIPAILTGCDLMQQKIAEQVSPAAIDQFLTIDPGNDIGKQINQTCTADVSMSNIATTMWWPTCETPDDVDKCTDSCFSPDLITEMDAFNKKHGGKLVTYKSRAGEGNDTEVVQLKGWWLPAPNATADTPRIVVQHGFKSNSNKVRVQVAAYLLRKLGYSVLVNNLRDHCYSDASSHGVVGWGHAYPMDTLGAWDYLKDEAADPIDASKVGILGFSMGGFITANAFGLENKVPGVWIDGAPFTPKDGFEAAFAGGVGDLAGSKAGDVGKSLGTWVGGHISDETWDLIEKEAAKKGVDLNNFIPEKTLMKDPGSHRPVYVTANKQDATVPFSSTSKFVELFKKNSDAYTLKGFWEQEKTCGGDGHCFGHLIYTDEYEGKLCKFWSGVFGTEASCGSSGGNGNGEGDGDAEANEGDAETKLFETGRWSLRAARSNISSIVVASFIAVTATVVFVTMGRRMRARRSLVNQNEQENLIPDEE